LAGLFLISDDQEAALALPDGDRDLPIVIQDRLFDADNQLIYDPSVMGMYGDRILVNGTRITSLMCIAGHTACAC
jgi:FtsP/CotA-like multicopper oxidase with cupredoxin domain